MKFQCTPGPDMCSKPPFVSHRWGASAATSSHFKFQISNLKSCAMRLLASSALIASVAIFGGMVELKGMAVESNGLLLVDNKGEKTLGIIDPESGRQIAVVEEDGETGHEVAASPDGKRAFVPIYGNSGVGHPGTDGRLLRVIDLQSRKIIGTVDFGKGVRPHCAGIGPKNHLLYVTTELENSIAVIDPESLKIVGSVPTGQEQSHMLA